MPKILDIITYPDPRLREKARELTPTEIATPEIQELLLDMAQTMNVKDGAGLAAPQIGQEIRIVCLLQHHQVFFLINPVITKKSWGTQIEDEGCLSIVNKAGEIVFGKVERHKRVTCSFLDQKGNKKKIQAEGMLARAIQHELDHLDGILFIDHMDKKAVEALEL